MSERGRERDREREREGEREREAGRREFKIRREKKRRSEDITPDNKQQHGEDPKGPVLRYYSPLTVASLHSYPSQCLQS